MPQAHLRRFAGLLILAALSAACSSSPQPLSRPNAVALAPDGSLYVMDRGNYRVAHLASDGRLLDAFGKFGTGPGDIARGWSLARDPAGNLYFCNIQYDDEGEANFEGVKVFTPEGQFVREIVVPGDDGSKGCYSVRVDEQGRIYAVFTFANELWVLDPQGQPLGMFFGKQGDGPGEFDGLQDIALDGQRGLLYASDSINSRVQQFKIEPSASGVFSLTHQLSFGSYGQEPGQFAYPQFLAVDEASGELYVGDLANRRIQVFGPEGGFRREFRPPGVELWHAQGLTIGADGALYVADALNNVVWVFEADGRLRDRIEVQG